MDKAEPNTKLAEDSTRESLIAISYGLPEADQSAAASPKSTKREKAGGDASPRDGGEKYRSELISISYSPSPDAKPLSPAEHDG